MSGVTTATVLAGITAAAAVGSTAYSIANKPSAPKAAAAPTMDSGASNTDAATTAEAQLGPGRAADIAAGGDSGSSLDESDQYSVKKKLLGD